MTVKKPNSFQGVSPVLLPSSCDVLQNNSAIPNSGELSYPFRKAIMIEEIVWILRIASSTALNLGSLVFTKLMLGQHYLMRDQVPIWSLGTEMDFLVEEKTDTTLNTVFTYSAYRWRLPEPLYLDAGQVLSSAFYRGGDGFGSINVQVAYRGRTVAPNQPRPKIIPIPYAAPFVTATGGVGGSGYEQSNEFDLFNPFDKDLRVQRVTGRVLSFTSNTTAAAVKALTQEPYGDGINILIDDSWGGKIVNNQTGPSDVFDSARAAWTVDTILPAKGQYNVRVMNMSAAQQLHLAVIGSREERL